MALDEGRKRELGVGSVTIPLSRNKPFEQLPIRQPTQNAVTVESANVSE
jgi:hypothetical protein